MQNYLPASPQRLLEVAGRDALEIEERNQHFEALRAARRGLAMGPELAVADGALGFWQAVEIGVH